MTERASLLVVDDEPEICEILLEYFTQQGFAVHSAGNADQARQLMTSNTPDLVILDIRMPGEDGLSLARWLRDAHQNTGIIMLTTAADVVDRIVGLEIGADDYVAKPFDLRELLARVKSVIRRQQQTSPSNAPNGRIRVGTCELDLGMHKLFDASGDEMPLTAMEFDLLRVFTENPNRALNRDQIMELAHHRDWDVYDRSIDLRIMRLRRKIERNPEKPDTIKTVRGVGYMYIQ